MLSRQLLIDDTKTIQFHINHRYITGKQYRQSEEVAIRKALRVDFFLFPIELVI